MSRRHRAIPQAQLPEIGRRLVDLAWKMSDTAYVPYSQFPVGAAILACNDAGEIEVFGGCNVEAAGFNVITCAERVAIPQAVRDGYRRLLAIAVVCAKAPGSSPCGACRQVIREFGKDAVILNINGTRTNSTVRIWTLDELLPDSFGLDQG